MKIRVYAMISNTNENLDFLSKGIIEKERLTVRSVKAYRCALGSRGALLENLLG